MDKITNVTGCSGCPLHRAEHTHYCAHPALVTEEDAHIIHRDRLSTVPEKCPLRQAPLVHTIKLGAAMSEDRALYERACSEIDKAIEADKLNDYVTSLLARVQELEASTARQQQANDILDDQLGIAVANSQRNSDLAGLAVTDRALAIEAQRKAEAKVQELERLLHDRTLEWSAAADDLTVAHKQRQELEAENAQHITDLNFARERQAHWETEAYLLEREVAELKKTKALPAQWNCPYCGYGEYRNRADWERRAADHIVECNMRPREPEPEEATPFDTGLCCMSRHATAVAPWTCDCPCHSKAT